MNKHLSKLLSLLHYSKHANQIVPTSQRSISKTPDEWHTYWQAQGQPWRTEQEIDTKRQKELATCLSRIPDIENGIYPYNGMKLSRADIEWLLTTHENGQGPVDWSDYNQRNREGIDVRGADLRQVDLSGLPLACMIGGLGMLQNQPINSDHRKKAAVVLDGANLRQTHLEGAILYNASVRGAALQGAYLQNAKARWARMEGSRMRGAHLDGADLRSVHLEGNTLAEACLDGTDLPSAFFDAASTLTTLGSRENTALVFEVRWGGVDLAHVDWSQVILLGDERFAKKQTKKDLHLAGLHQAVRAYRKLAVELQEQGLNEEAARFAYRAQVLQKSVRRFQILQPNMKLRQRIQALGAWLFSWFLFLLAGYGYKPGRSFFAYLIVIIVFALSYYLLGLSDAGPHHLAWNEAFVVSMTAFHGRGFFADQFHPGDPLFWQQDWKEKPRDTRIDILQKIVREEQWIIEGTYLSSSEPRLNEADTIIFLDINLFICLRRIFKRHRPFMRLRGLIMKQQRQSQELKRRDLPEGCIDKLNLIRILKVIVFPIRGRRTLVKLLSNYESKQIIWLRSADQVDDFLAQLESYAFEMKQSSKKPVTAGEGRLVTA